MKNVLRLINNMNRPLFLITFNKKNDKEHHKLLVLHISVMGHAFPSMHAELDTIPVQVDNINAEHMHTDKLLH